MLLYIVFSIEFIVWAWAKSPSFISFLVGGIAGAIFITITMLVMSSIGMASTFGLIIPGQVIMAVLFDHFNLLVAQQTSIYPRRIF